MNQKIPLFNERISDRPANTKTYKIERTPEMLQEMREIEALEDAGLLPMDSIALSCRRMTAAKSKGNKKNKRSKKS